jgi:transcriptional regulator with XRE-family HTH domain
MTGEELKEIRQAFNLSAASMGRALGYSGPKANIAVTVRRLERNSRAIPAPVARLAHMFAENGIPKVCLATRSTFGAQPSPRPQQITIASREPGGSSSGWLCTTRKVEGHRSLQRGKRLRSRVAPVKDEESVTACVFRAKSALARVMGFWPKVSKSKYTDHLHEFCHCLRNDSI